MSLTEQQAQQITIIRVLEQTQSNGALWSVDDAKAATHATIDLVGTCSARTSQKTKRSNMGLNYKARGYAWAIGMSTQKVV